MKIWHISDTHSYHYLLTIPNNIDIVIFSGDCSNPREPSINEGEVRTFITWFSSLPIRYKIFVAGNHDTSIEKGYITKDNFTQAGIIYLENESIEIPNGFEPIKIWGSPYTPSFGIGWAFNKSRATINRVWDLIPEDTDIVVVHGPPKGALDLSYDKEGKLEFCGCSALAKKIINIKPKLCLFGHIHNSEDVTNAGYTIYSNYKTIYSNGSVLTDGKFGKLSSNGNMFVI